MYNRELLKFISEQSHTEGFAAVAAEWASELKKMESAGYVDIDPGSPDGDGNIRVAVTNAGDLWLDPSEGAMPVFAAPPVVASAPVIAAVPTFTPPPLIASSEAPTSVPVWVGVDLAQPGSDKKVIAPIQVRTDEVGRISLEPVFDPGPSAYLGGAKEYADETLKKSPPDPIVGTGIVAGLAPPPPKAKRGRKGKPNPYQEYIDTMESGMAFYIAPTEDKKNPVRDYYHLVHSANIKYSDPEVDAYGTKIIEQKTRNRAIKNADGSYRLDENSAKVYEQITTEVPVRKQFRDYAIYPAKEVPNQPYVEGAYVFRLK